MREKQTVPIMCFHHQAFAGLCLPFAWVSLPIAALYLPIAAKGMSYTVGSTSVWSASVCGSYNIAESVHAASFKPCVTCGHSSSVSAGFHVFWLLAFAVACFSWISVCLLYLGGLKLMDLKEEDQSVGSDVAASNPWSCSCLLKLWQQACCAGCTNTKTFHFVCCHPASGTKHLILIPTPMWCSNSAAHWNPKPTPMWCSNFAAQHWDTGYKPTISASTVSQFACTRKTLGVYSAGLRGNEISLWLEYAWNTSRANPFLLYLATFGLFCVRGCALWSHDCCWGTQQLHLYDSWCNRTKFTTCRVTVDKTK